MFFQIGSAYVLPTAFDISATLLSGITDTATVSFIKIRANKKIILPKVDKLRFPFTFGNSVHFQHRRVKTLRKKLFDNLETEIFPFHHMNLRLRHTSAKFFGYFPYQFFFIYKLQLTI